MPGRAAREKGPLTDGARWWVRHNPEFHQQLARRHADGVTPADGPARFRPRHGRNVLIDNSTALDMHDIALSGSEPC